MALESDQVQASGPELFLGLVGAAGANLETVERTLRSALGEVGYETTVIRLSDVVHDFLRWKHLADIPHEDQRIELHMKAGRELRTLFERGDALALLAVAKLHRDIRQTSLGLPANNAARRRAYIFRSLKHPSEVATLRRLYGPAFLLVGAYSPRKLRQEQLAKSISVSRGSHRPDDFVAQAHELVKVDEEELGVNFGQSVRKVFPEADVFVNAADGESLEVSTRRFVELVFGHPYHTPSKDEYAIFHARASALRSASMARQVGAVVADDDGEIIVAGCNEVPKSHGGLYWPGDKPDGRDFKLGSDSSDTAKLSNLSQILDVLATSGWLEPGRASEDPRKRAEEAKSLVGRTQAMSPIEYVRAVHGEMAALMAAARRGVSVRGGTLYTTTFPCHDCAKHIVAVGIKKVVYIEPYPKSLAEEMHKDSLVVDDGDRDTSKVVFQPFVGVAPRIYMTLFAAGDRKTEDGQALDWSKTKTKSVPRVTEAEQPLYFIRETMAVSQLDLLISKHSAALSTPDT